jgi:hypothetical protein
MTPTARGRCRTSRLAVLSNLVALGVALGCGSSKPAGTPDGSAGAGGKGGATMGAAGGGAGVGGGAGGGGTGGDTGVAGSGSAGTGGGGAMTDGGAGTGGSAAGDASSDLPPVKLDEPWLTRDVGELGDGGAARGSLLVSSSTLTVRGTGVGVGGTSDGFFFAYQRLQGDGEIVGRVQTLFKTSPTSRIGIMVRADDDDPGAPNVFLAVDGDGAGGHLQARLSKGGATTSTADVNLKAGRMLRLQRLGKVIMASIDDGAGGWLKLTSFEIDLSSDMLLGLAATDGVPGSIASAGFDVARIASIVSVGPMKGWVASELGTTGGSAIVSDQAVTISGLGMRTSLTSDVGMYFMQEASGGHTVTAKVLAIDGPNADSRVGIMMREGPPDAPLANAAYAFISATKGKGIEFGNRSKTGWNAQVGIGMAGEKAPIFLRLEKRDSTDGTSTFTGFLSADGKNWNVLDVLTFTLQEPYSLGVFVLSNSVTTFSGGRIADITVADPK